MNTERSVHTAAERSAVRPHLVVKRGHHGRYRFVMLDDGERIGGEVWVDAHAEPPDVAHALALAKIARLAEALLIRISTRATLKRQTDRADRSQRRSRVDEAHSRRETPQEGGSDDKV